MIVQAMCDHFSLNILNICPDLKNFLILEQDQDLEVSFLNKKITERSFLAIFAQHRSC